METKYFQVITTKELVATYYVKATDYDKAEELAWEKFGEELYQLKLEDCWGYDTRTEETDADAVDDWIEEEDFLTAVNNGGEV